MNDSSNYLTNNQSRKPIYIRRLIHSPADAVWNIISLPGNLEKCHPFCEKNPVHVWPGDSARDEIHYLNGSVFTRKFVRWIDNVGYDLFISKIGGKESFVSWRIEPAPNEQCYLSIRIYLYKLQNIPKGFRWIANLLYIRPMLKKYLLSVVGGFEYHLQTGQPVLNNHFGSHSWFSINK